MQVKIEVKEIDNVSIIYIFNRLDIYLSYDLEEKIDEIIKNKPDNDILLNLINVKDISSSGLRVFISALKKLKVSNRKLKVCNVNNTVMGIFQITMLQNILDIQKDEETALESFKNEKNFFNK